MSISMTRAVPAVLLSVLLSGSTLALAAPAHADRWTYDDAAGDVTRTVETDTSISLETLPEQANGDITQVVVEHRRTKVVLELRTRARVTGFFGVSAVLRTPGHPFMMMSMRAPGLGGTDLMDFSPHSKDGTVRCPGLKRKLLAGHTTIRFAIPRSCLGHPRWVRVGVSMVAGSMFSAEINEDDGLRTAMTLSGMPAMSPKIRR
ncbi:hypothetical protein [Nocardioides daeguensis]|uniref:Uncharacterized protein n=1 Tax=Nocardioides daeguensis TaxID=908359 RepID=A0ABP6VPV0_9ACTN|nr:hypothetical protein [Nocardioides daeguensis]MBV6727482.1 hypothetical protein [Nocardioides daeguensis]MCR1773296.1 hypothetical protein [Nocardioides daeguensis]